jgi:hypothetical protein
VERVCEERETERVRGRIREDGEKKRLGEITI